MTIESNNHNLKFTYYKTGADWPGNGDYMVKAGNVFIGHVKKAPGGWTAFNTDNVESAYRVGPRQYAAEHLAVKAGLLDGNYNAITK